MATTPTAAYGHDVESLDAWVTEWIDTALDVGVTIEAFHTYMDMAARHPQFFGRPVPVRTRRTDATRPPTAGTASAEVEQWRTLVAAYFPADQVDRALRIMACESRGNPLAKNPGSSASGLFQHLARYWPTRSAKAGWAGASIWSAEANVAVAAWLWRTGGWGHWICK